MRSPHDRGYLSTSPRSLADSAGGVQAVAANDHRITDQVTLSDIDAQVYEAIATLEFIGYQVKAKDIVTASDLDEDTVLQALQALTQRGVLVSKKRGSEDVYAPAHRGWSAAPERAANPNR